MTGTLAKKQVFLTKSLSYSASTGIFLENDHHNWVWFDLEIQQQHVIRPVECRAFLLLTRHLHSYVQYSRIERLRMLSKVCAVSSRSATPRFRGYFRLRLWI